MHCRRICRAISPSTTCHAAEIEFDAGTFTVTLLIDLPPFTKGARFAGRHRTQDGLIATALIVPF